MTLSEHAALHCLQGKRWNCESTTSKPSITCCRSNYTVMSRVCFFYYVWTCRLVKYYQQLQPCCLLSWWRVYFIRLAQRHGKRTILQIIVTQFGTLKPVILSSSKRRTKVSYAASVWNSQTNKGAFSFFQFQQFRSCSNLLSNYANEFRVGGSPSRSSRDLDSLEKEQKVSFLLVSGSGRGRTRGTKKKS